MKETVHCIEHGEQACTFVCRHLVEALRSGANVGFFWSGEPRGDAWCASCEDARIAYGGDTGDWNDVSEAIADIRILCGGCYDRLKALHGV